VILDDFAARSTFRLMSAAGEAECRPAVQRASPARHSWSQAETVSPCSPGRLFRLPKHGCDPRDRASAAGHLENSMAFYAQPASSDAPAPITLPKGPNAYGLPARRLRTRHPAGRPKTDVPHGPASADGQVTTAVHDAIGGLWQGRSSPCWSVRLRQKRHCSLANSGQNFVFFRHAFDASNYSTGGGLSCFRGLPTKKYLRMNPPSPLSRGPPQ
jgi:hypothetical protein